MPKDIAMHYIGSGYDLCGKYADGVSIKRKIFDLDKVPERSLRELSNREAQYFSVSGESVEEYQSNLAVQAKVSGRYKLFSASVESSFTSTDLSIKETSYVSINLCMRYETWKLQVTSKEYMYPEVVEKFNTKDGKCSSGISEQHLEQAEYAHILNAQSVPRLEVDSLGDRNKIKKVRGKNTILK